MKILVVIPAYNEEANIERVVKNLIDNYPQYDYVVVNDGSKDQTAEICKKNHFNLLDQPINLGLAGAFQTGMKYAYKMGYDAAIQFDGDGQHRPEYIEKMVELCRKNDIQIVFTTVTQDPRTVAQYAEKFAQADSYIRNLAQKLNVEYYNFNYLTFEAFDREEGDFWDREGHMYGDTAKRFTKVYAEVLKKALAGSLKKSDYFGEDLKEIYKDVVPYE